MSQPIRTSGIGTLEALARDVLLLISELASTTNDAIQELDEKITSSDGVDVSYDSQNEKIIFKKKGEA